MVLINDVDQTRINKAIKAAEATTSGEIVVVLAAQSDGYGYVPPLFAALLALLVPWPLIYFTWLPVTYIFLAQLAVFLATFILAQPAAVRLALVPKSVKHDRAHRHAVDQFLVQNLHTTTGRTGVLIFVSEAEHFAEIIADKQIYDRVSKDQWQAIVDDLTHQIARDQAVDGFLQAIETSGRMLAEHFPPGSGNLNELPDHMIIIA